MSRPKGSLNKATLERLKFEQKVRELMEKENAEHLDKFKGVSKDYTSPNSGYNSFFSSTPQSVASDISDSEKTVGKNPKEEVNSLPIETNKVPKNSEFSNPTKNKAEVKEEIKEIPKKRRGRPRKNPEPVENSVENVEKSQINNHESFETNEVSETEKKPKKRTNKSEDKKSDHCSRCDTIILCSPNRTDTNAVSGVSDCHRSCPRYVILCDSCSQELSKLIDEWLWNNGLGVKPKPWSEFGVKEMRQSESESEINSEDESSDENDSDVVD